MTDPGISAAYQPPPQDRLPLPAPEGLQRPQGFWTDRVRFSDNGAIAFAPKEVLITGDEAFAKATEIIADRYPDQKFEFSRQEVFGDEMLLRTDQEFDVEYVVAELRYVGFGAEPNYVFFSHNQGGCTCGCGCGGGLQANPFTSNPFTSNPFTSNPFTSNPFTSNPFTSNPFTSNPFTSNPFTSNPFTSNPFTSNQARNTGARSSSAIPAEDPELIGRTIPEGVARVIIFDTGIALKDELPALLQRPNHIEADRIDREEADESGDEYLDPVSGHGTFIAGIIEQIAPGQDVYVAGVMTTFGDGKASLIAERLDAIREGGLLNERTIINMSFGAYADVEMRVIARAIRLAQNEGAVVVASAGNDNTCRPTYPAVLPGVVGVASVEGYGKAPYSNYGNWVSACAPGSNVVSAFFNNYDGKAGPLPNSIDPDHYRQWAEWSGTSFSGPAVAAALASHIATTGQTAKQAVTALVDNPALLRLPGLGTVVNAAPGSP